MIVSIKVTPDVTADNPADLPKPASSLSGPGAQPRSANERQSSDWDIRNAPKNYLSLVASHVVTAFFSFASVWLVTRHLGPDGYGAIVAVVAASQLVQIFLNWSSTALARFGIEEFVETGRITRSFWTRTIILLPNLLGVILLSGFWLGPVASWLKIPEPAIWLIGAHLVATALWLHIQYAMQGAKMLRLQGVMLAVERGLTFLFLLAVIGSTGLTLQFALWAYIIPAALLTLVGILMIRPYVGVSGLFEAAHFRRMLVYSLPLIPYAIVGYLSTSQLDAFFITRYLSTTDLGIYAVAAQINGIALQLPILANTILVSLFVSLRTGQKDDVANRYFQHVLPTVALGWCLLCLTAGSAAAWAIPLTFGAGFDSSVTPLWILLAASAVSAPSMFGYAAFSHAISATYISSAAAICAAVVNVVFNIVLIPSLGLAGCAIASLLSATALNIVVVMLTRQRSGISISWALYPAIPSYIGVLTLVASNSTPMAFLASFLLICAIAAFFRTSLKETFDAIPHRFHSAGL